ncbi:putative nuclease HARBI1 [Lucilia cuprina]|nr:putative nuclease HARBI1 [Lucilia cuprina]
MPKFYEETRFPGVIGAVDCTHVQIKRPKSDVESCYLNRKGYHSQNVQLICDFNLKILGGFARFGGSAHDAYIWEASQINALMQQRFETNRSDHTWLLGDSGYPLRPWIITPYRSSATEDEKRFNFVHAKAINCIKRLNGVLKSVFRCLHVGLQTTPQMAGKIINACTVLHNFRKEHGLLTENITIEEEEEDNIFSNGEEVKEPLRLASRLRDSLKERICRQ